MVGKRGQVYLIATVIFSILIFGLITEVNKVRKKPTPEEFFEISEVYKIEAPNLINYAKYRGLSDDEIEQLLSDFSDIFITYAKTKNPDIGLLYVYSKGRGAFVKNLLGDLAKVGGSTIYDGDTINDISIKVGGEEFIHVVPSNIEGFGGIFSSKQTISTKPTGIEIGGVTYPLEILKETSFYVILRLQDGDEIWLSCNIDNVGGEELRGCSQTQPQ